METKIVEISKEARECKLLQEHVRIREMKPEEWLKSGHLSGTLVKNARIGMKWKSQFLEEALAYTLGWIFESRPASRITFGDPITEGDEKAITEAGWFIERYMTLKIFPEDIYEAKYIIVHDEGEKREGIGIVVKQTSIQWLPKGHLIFAIISEYDTEKEEWKSAENPF